MAATIAFLALQTGTVTKVHLVFTNAILMRKDEEDFDALWIFLGLKDAVLYHSDIAFTVEDKELILFDEADEYIYN